MTQEKKRAKLASCTFVKFNPAQPNPTYRTQIEHLARCSKEFSK